jgi:hypothetical protein
MTGNAQTNLPLIHLSCETLLAQIKAHDKQGSKNMFITMDAQLRHLLLSKLQSLKLGLNKP